MTNLCTSALDFYFDLSELPSSVLVAADITYNCTGSQFPVDFLKGSDQMSGRPRKEGLPTGGFGELSKHFVSVAGKFCRKRFEWDGTWTFSSADCINRDAHLTRHTKSLFKSFFASQVHTIG